METDKEDICEIGCDGERPEVTKFRQYLQIKSVQPDPDYVSCVKFLKSYADELNLKVTVVECSANRPIIVMTLEGEKDDLPSILLNSHTDVVPVFLNEWKYDPFAAVKEKSTGLIYGRGTQDMKCVSIQYLEAIRRLIKDSNTKMKPLKRTVHLSFVPDEEIGGHTGMEMFVNGHCEGSQHFFKDLNVGIALDEGLASEGEVVPLYYGERNAFWVEFKIPGTAGHGSQFIENTAAEKSRSLINKLLEFRESQKVKLQERGSEGRLGDVTTINLTMMSGGVQINVVPDAFKLGFDIRIDHSWRISDFEEMLIKWKDEIDSEIVMSFLQKFTDQTLTDISNSDPWFSAVSEGLKESGVKFETQVFPGGTDSRYLRRAGLPAFGFSPMPRTPILLHCSNEYLHENTFLNGICVFEKLIKRLANV